jgi:hypothetical protein
MRLLDLDPEWVTNATPASYRRTDNFTEAQGILFACPFCYRKNNGLVGTHMILIYFADRGAPPECEPLPRWTVAGGTGLNDLTLVPSINLQNEGRPDEWHGWITNGEIVGSSRWSPDEQPGDYCGPVTGFAGADQSTVFFLKPNARDPDAPARARVVHHVNSPPHAFREPDGSLTITASIGDHNGPGESDGCTGI